MKFSKNTKKKKKNPAHSSSFLLADSPASELIGYQKSSVIYLVCDFNYVIKNTCISLFNVTLNCFVFIKVFCGTKSRFYLIIWFLKGLKLLSIQNFECFGHFRFILKVVLSPILSLLHYIKRGGVIRWFLLHGFSIIFQIYLVFSNKSKSKRFQNVVTLSYGIWQTLLSRGTCINA